MVENNWTEFAKLSSAEETDMVAGFDATDAGKMWYNTTLKCLRQWDEIALVAKTVDINPVVQVFSVDKGRTDTYVEDGSYERPFKTIMAAVNKVIANGDNTQAKPYALVINPGVYAENVVLESAALKSLIFIGMGSRLQTQISPAAGNALQSEANNDNLYDLHMENIQFNKPTSMIGASNNTFFGYNFFFSNVYWSSTAPATFKNMTYPTILSNISKLSGGVTFSNVTLATVSEMGGIKTGSFVVETDENANKPNSFSGGTKVNVQDGAYPNCTFSLLNIVALTGTTLQVRVARYGSAGQTIPANASILAYNSTLLGDYVNNGTLTLYNSIVSGALTGTAPVLYQPSSQYKNDSGVTGTTVKDALNTLNVSYLAIPVIDSATQLTIADGVMCVPIPEKLNGFNVTSVRANVYTAGLVANTTDIQLRRRRAGASVDMLSTKVTLSVGEYTVADGVVDPNNDDLQTGDLLLIDVDALNSTAPYGLAVTIKCEKP